MLAEPRPQSRALGVSAIRVKRNGLDALRVAFVGAVIVWAGALLLAPYIVARPAPVLYAWALAVYAIGSFVCHQLPERSFHLLAVQMPVCARCTGIYAGAALVALAALATAAPTTGFTSRWPLGSTAGWERRLRVTLVVASLPTVATLLYEWWAGGTTNWVRALTALPLGAALALMVVRAE
jgi:hypothetical protein